MKDSPRSRLSPDSLMSAASRQRVEPSGMRRQSKMCWIALRKNEVLENVHMMRAHLAGVLLLLVLAILVLLISPLAADAEAPDFSGSGTPIQYWKISCETALRKSGAPAGQCFFYIDLTGDIDEQQLELLTQSISYKHDVEAALKTKLKLRVLVNSRGGRVTTAMQIGRLIRSESGIVAVDNDCLSSCIFILIGGIERQVRGRIGIHRLFLDTGVKSTTALPSSIEIKTAIDKLIADADAYVDEMNIPRRIIDDITSVPSDSIRMLTVDDLLHYGILPVDPYEQEVREIAEANAIGISHAEYLARKNLVRKTCYPDRSDNPYLQNPFDEFDDCYQKIMHASQ